MSLTYYDISRVACEIAEERGNWSGYPVPIEGLKLVIAEGYAPECDLNGASFGDNFVDKFEEAMEQSGVFRDWKIVNSWWCARRGGTVHIWRTDKGKLIWFIDPEYAKRPMEMLNRIMKQMEVSFVQTKEAEVKAMRTLQQMIKPHLFNMYVLQGVFMETSAKSGVTYVFRKGRPTIATKADKDGQMKVLSILCLHPLGYYEDSFASCLVPTDDVICHLVMMRAYEHLFWRKANHHRSWDWRAGL